jgi:hypothetical protein
MKYLLLASALMMAMNVMACDGSGKSKDKEKKPEDERITTIR